MFLLWHNTIYFQVLGTNYVGIFFILIFNGSYLEIVDG
jgi:hypothetical protein